MGMAFQEGEFTITQYGRSEKAEIKVEDALGFQCQKDGTWAMVGDFYHCQKENLRKYYTNTNIFQRDIQTAYSVVEATEALEGQNFTCVENSGGTVGKDGMVRMVFESTT